MRSLICLISALVALAAQPAAADRYVARNGLQVAGSGLEFEVFTRAGNGGSDYFCAAGDFARSQLGSSTTDRVVLVRSRSPSPTVERRSSIGFRVISDRSGGVGLSDIVLLPWREGQSRSVGHSIALCTEFDR